MRIAMFSPESLHSIFEGGLAVHVTELAAGLRRRGHEVHVITRRATGQRAYDHIHGVHYHRVTYGVSRDVIETADWMCKAMAHCFHEISTGTGKVDIAHAHDWMAINALKYVMHGFAAPGILSMHSTEYGRDGNVFFDGFARRVRDVEASGCHAANLVIAVSNFLADEVSRIYHVPREKIHAVHNGVSYRAFDGFIDPVEVKRRFGIPPMAPLIFSPARLTLQKGMDMLVQAVPMVLASFPDARVVISGEGPEKNRIVELAQRSGCAHAIVFAGVLPRAHYVDVIRACNLVAVPSRNEPFGIVVLEAWAAGKPVVVTTSGGPREFVRHDVDGFLVDANPQGIAHGLGTLLANLDHGRWLGANGRQAVEQTFNWDTIANYTEGVYRVLIH